MSFDIDKWLRAMRTMRCKIGRHDWKRAMRVLGTVGEQKCRWCSAKRVRELRAKRAA